MHDSVLILDFGSQYTQLIARKIRQCGVYCEIHPYSVSLPEIKALNPKALILSGSPFSIAQTDAPRPDAGIWELDIPILGICYGMQLIAERFGAEISPAPEREYGKAELQISRPDPLLDGVESGAQIWMSHADKIQSISHELIALASSQNSVYAALRHQKLPIYALQFHPEVHHSLCGKEILANFLFKIAGLKADWQMSSFISESIRKIREQVGDDKVILGLSGGVDSSVTAALLFEAIGEQLIPIFVDTGMMRFREKDRVKEMFKSYPDLKIDFVDASALFLSRLQGVSDPEQKRKIIGASFIEIFDREAAKFPDAMYLAQGTLYPDVIESVSFSGPSVTIKSHHNVGGLPEDMKLKLIEPLRELFKDEVRELGKALNLPEELVQRHPFPGPGLAVRILGPVDAEKVRILQAADEIFIQELWANKLYHSTWQAFAVLLPIRSVGVMGDERSYDQVCALRAVNSVDGMTAEATEFPWDFLSMVSNRICNEVKGISRVVYDISSKPPATIEWE
ncbi:MAG: glutamine-hydrolyzing GMP synthase [Candidatus Cloacimonadaceae bacterium]|jgi:GMP synthase (glutamine-hydrolysing)|nr:glutamine-hydrolyzing GMP synthase [Candidatus Cloacimonadota bacterium]MDY0126607.1 glutamine-hydrolyzing GMP synthase [Candidatus Cloacimonadaceae bacterium]MCB5255221.1 glutamine-hydrolyzing GMP synthase [Candidatus Cloacimonadota bacterium]MCK9177443.1 glutamine-hydrolyzing GMP synthase [Candidatus Cloacimonadota bacterium]MCK9243217.1 glutamine-hydrolyzing GMP synthase [Candidatus Cloacimonadota bacterium]